MNPKSYLKALLFSGSMYFTAVSTVHFLGIKVPMLYVYYDIPSNAYQDRIISILCFAFALFLYAGFRILNRNIEIVKYIVIAGLVSVTGLLINNLISGTELKTNPIYWVEISILGIYSLLLLVSYIFVNKRINP